jgi:tRNA-2-methylthio-N6-dimethylallyladenosine synthase
MAPTVVPADVTSPLVQIRTRRGGDTATAATGPRVYVETHGCQMNVADSELLLGVLTGAGYAAVTRPGRPDADVVVVNTCAVREKAEDARSSIARTSWARCKRQRPELVISIVGCMAEHLKERPGRPAPRRST